MPLGQLLALVVSPAGEGDRAKVGELTEAVREATGEGVEVAGYPPQVGVDQDYTGERPAEDAAARGIRLEVVKVPGAKRGFVLLPRRWVVERSFAWLARFRRLSRDYERLPQTLTGLRLLAFSTLMLRRFATLIAQSA